MLKELEERGFTIMGTGGNCEAYHIELMRKDQSYILVTDGDASLPTSLDDGGIVGFYDRDGNMIGYMQFECLKDALPFIDCIWHGLYIWKDSQWSTEARRWFDGKTG